MQLYFHELTAMKGHGQLTFYKASSWFHTNTSVLNSSELPVFEAYFTCFDVSIGKNV